MTNRNSWTFLSMVQFLLRTSILTTVDANFHENIALNKIVTQSSNLNYPTTGDVWPARNAVDGNKDCTLVDKDHYSGTDYEIVPWWQVDLGNIYSISTIIVYGQPYENPVQLKGFQVYLLTSENSTSKRHIYNNTNYGNGVFTIPVQPNLFGRYLRIERTYREANTGILVLCEVEVYPTGCPVGSFGNQCLGRCNCKNGVACDVNTGHCDSCPLGYIGDSCQTACDDGKYGQNCSESCSGHCKNGNQQCNKTNGICMQECVDGYIGKRCENEWVLQIWFSVQTDKREVSRIFLNIFREACMRLFL